MNISRQYSPESPAESYDSDGGIDKGKLAVVAVIAIVVIAAISALVLFTGGDDGNSTSTSSKCGNAKCETGENCASCAKDCACGTKESCISGTCTLKEDDNSATCGDGKCSGSETSANCCQDCGCKTGECNKNTQKCETSTASATSLCGNGKCDSSENCLDCPGDCKCSSGEYCSSETKTCTTSECGNGICENGEYPSNCCDDCGCMTPECETCNTDTHVCEIPEAGISDEEAIEIITNYYTEKGMEVENVTIGGSTCTKGEPSKAASVMIKDSEIPIMVRIMENGEIARMSTFPE